MQTVSRPLFELSVHTRLSRPPGQVYAVVSDLGRSGEWSPECVGGAWIAGEPGAVGAVFRGENHRVAEVVAWAPVVRGTWFTESEVVAADRGRTFQWAMRTKAGEQQDSVWAYDIAPTPDGGSVLTHRFRMGAATEGIRGITAGMDASAADRFFAEWSTKLAGDMRVTVERIRRVVECAGTTKGD